MLRAHGRQTIDSKDHRCQWILFQLTYSFTVCSPVLRCFSPSIFVLALYILISPSQRPSPRFFSVSMPRMSSFSASMLHLARGVLLPRLAWLYGDSVAVDAWHLGEKRQQRQSEIWGTVDGENRGSGINKSRRSFLGLVNQINSASS
jgi:hypothetical protein